VAAVRRGAVVAYLRALDRHKEKPASIMASRHRPSPRNHTSDVSCATPNRRALVIRAGHHCDPQRREVLELMLSARPIRSAAVLRPATGALPPALQAQRCAEAFIELCGRIWLELEHLAHLNGLSRSCRDSSSDLAAETLRLELLLVIDACESAAWVLMLDPDVRRRLLAMSREVLAIIAVGSNELTLDVIECAQDRVFDEVESVNAPVQRCGEPPGLRSVGRF